MNRHIVIVKLISLSSKNCWLVSIRVFLCAGPHLASVMSWPRRTRLLETKLFKSNLRACIYWPKTFRFLHIKLVYRPTRRFPVGLHTVSTTSLHKEKPHNDKHMYLCHVYSMRLIIYTAYDFTVAFHQFSNPLHIHYSSGALICFGNWGSWGLESTKSTDGGT